MIRWSLVATTLLLHSCGGEDASCDISRADGTRFCTDYEDLDQAGVDRKKSDCAAEAGTFMQGALCSHTGVVVGCTSKIQLTNEKVTTWYYEMTVCGPSIETTVEP